MKKTLLVLLLSTVFASVSFAQSNSRTNALTHNNIQTHAAAPVIDKKATTTAPWKMNEVVMQGNITLSNGTTHAVYRKFLGMTSDADYVVQDFYNKNNIARTTPYLTTKESVTPLIIRPQTGRFIMFHPDGSKKEDGTYINGQEDGLWRFWYDNGQLFLEGAQKEGYFVGIVKAWYENGALLMDANVQILSEEKDKRPSVALRDENARRDLNFAFQFSQLGEARGSIYMWYEDGKPHMEGMGLVGSDGFTLKQWYENGQVGMSEAKQFGENEENKPFIIWAPDGSKFSELVVLEEDAIRSTVWYPGTQIISYEVTSKIDSGMQIKAWHQNGQPSFVSQISNNDDNSTFAMWYENGQKMVEGTLVKSDETKAYFSNYGKIMGMAPEDLASYFLQNNPFFKITGHWDEDGNPTASR